MSQPLNNHKSTNFFNFGAKSCQSRNLFWLVSKNFLKLIKTNNVIGEIWHQNSKSLCLCAQSNSETSLSSIFFLNWLPFSITVCSQWRLLFLHYLLRCRIIYTEWKKNQISLLILLVRCHEMHYRWWDLSRDFFIHSLQIKYFLNWRRTQFF